MNLKGYLKKEYNVKFFKFFNLSIISEDREDGTYKHFIQIFFLNKPIVCVTYRTGTREDGKSFYFGTITRYNKTYYAGEENISVNTEDFSHDHNLYVYKSSFQDIKVSLITEDKELAKKVKEYYF